MRTRLGSLVAVATVVAACGGDAPGDSAGPAPAPVSTVAPGATVSLPGLQTTTPSSTVAVPVDTSAATFPGAPATSSTSSTTATTIPPALPPGNETFEGVPLGLELVADVTHPTAVAWRPGDDAMYVTTQEGLVVRFADGVSSVVLDLTDQVSAYAPGSERGLLGLAFDPRDGRMFLDYTDLDNDTHVVSYALDGDRAVAESRREVLFIDQPGLGHNGGRLLFDAAGNLYIGSGDGGASSGRDAQDTSKLLGVILRVVPALDGDGYEIPPSNPFADGVADRPEVIARGLRNPWTFSLDRATGDLWIGDVGNETMEEIDVMRAGESGLNFGWYWFEGTDQRRSSFPDGLTPPVYAYSRETGVAVMGGHVYRGTAIPELEGAYLFGDLTGPIWAIGAAGVSRLRVDPVRSLVGWAEDPSGELYVLSGRDGVLRLVRA